MSEVKVGKIDDSLLASVGIFIFDGEGVDDVNDDRTSLSLLDSIALSSIVGLELTEATTLDGSELGITDGNKNKEFG